MTIPRNLSNLAPGASSAGVLGVSYGGTNLTTLTAANNALYSTSASVLTAGTLPVAAGGTGSTTLTANNVLLGNGTSALQAVAPGASGNLLTSNGTTWASSAAPASSSGWVYITSVTSSGAATIDVESSFDSTYDTYVIVANNVKGTSNNLICMRLKIGGSYLTSNYVYSGFFVSSGSSTVFANYDSSTNAIYTGFGNSNTSADSLNYITYIYSPSSTTLNKQVSWLASGTLNSTTQQTSQVFAMNSTNTSALTGVRFYLNSSGNISGTFRLYGIKTS
jgi:hypothetical protein